MKILRLNNQTQRISIDLGISDWVVVDHLFHHYHDFSTRLNPDSNEIPLHPKLFDFEKQRENRLKEYDIKIESILKNHPERVIVYLQRAISNNNKRFKANWLKFELTMLIKNELSSISDQYSFSEKAIYLYKSLEKKLPFELFAKYCWFYFEPILKNNTNINVEVKGLIFKLTGIHNWSDFLAPSSSTPENKEDFIVKGNNTLNFNILIDDWGVDYTPWVTNKSLLKIYKNFEYDVQTQDSDSSQEEISQISQLYQTNTRMVLILGSWSVILKANDRNLSIVTKVENLETYLLWTKDYSLKWSWELLLDDNKLINNGQGDILYKMGFVNVLTIEMAKITLNKELQKLDIITNAPLKNLKSILLFPIIGEQLKQKIPNVILKSDIPETGRLSIELVASTFSVFCCHDSIICFLLFSQAADFHIQKSLKRISKKMSEKSNSINAQQITKESVIKEVESSDESDHEEIKIQEPINLKSILEEHKFHKIKEPLLDKKLSENTRSIIEEFDIINPVKKQNKEFKEGEVKLTDSLIFIDDYMVKNIIGNFIN